MTDSLPNDMLHAAGHAHMDISGQYDAPAMRAAIAAALRVLADRWMFFDLAHGLRGVADRIEHPAEDGAMSEFRGTARSLNSSAENASERDELAKVIRDETGLSGPVWFEVSNVADEHSLAEALIERGYRKVTVTPQQIEAGADMLKQPAVTTGLSRIMLARKIAHSFGLSVAEDG